MKNVQENAVHPPALFSGASSETKRAFLEFFSAQIRNVHTRKAYTRATIDFLKWCEEDSIHSLQLIQPLHVASWVSELEKRYSLPTTKLYLAAIRMLFDWLATHGVVERNPAQYVRGPRYSQRRGKTPVIEPDDVRRLFESIGDSNIAGLRDRALIGLMVYSFARVGAALAMNIEDVFSQGRRLWVRLFEKGGQVHEMPCHHALEELLIAYIDRLGSSDDKGALFRSLERGGSQLTERRLQHANAYEMIQKRCVRAGFSMKVCCHSFRATGITTYLANGGTIERAAIMANHASIRTTQLYDRRDDRITLDEVERIFF